MKIFSAVMFLLSSKLYKPRETDAVMIETDVHVVTTNTKELEPTSNGTLNGYKGPYPESQI